MPKASGPPAYVYVLHCADGSLYAGWTLDLTARLAAHRRGTAAKYTRSRLPLNLVACFPAADASQARRLEARFKRLTRAQKWEVVQGRQALGGAAHNACRMTFMLPVGEELRTALETARHSRVRIVTPRGDLVFAFYADDAPQHCAAFVKLAQAGFYDRLTFHRVEPGFVVQGGDPVGDGTGGPGYKLKAEFNARPHVRGTVAMARAAQPDSAGSQFYICLGDARFLDSQYTVFGQLLEGFEALDAIRRGDAMTKVSIEPGEPPR